MSILVVDDEASVRKVLQRIVASANYESVGVESGPAALAHLETVPDGSMTVILDVTMPGMSGHETAKEIRRRFPDTRILLTSGLSGQEAWPEVAHDEVDGFVQKPYTRRSLLDALEKVLATR